MQARDKYRKLSEEEKERLKESQKSYRDVKNSQYIIIIK